MALTSFNNESDILSATDRATLLDIARRSVQHGLDTRRALPVRTGEYTRSLQAHKASFVTLTIDQQLRGCIGSLTAQRALAEDVAQNAFAAAFRDPRFAALESMEYGLLHYHISILNEPEPLSFTSEDDLLAQLRPGVDGLVLEEGHHRGTFLPQVWDSLPDPEQFLRQLKQKAGLRQDHWSDQISIQRYTVEEIG